MITGGFKNMNADQIIKCILAVILKLEKSLNTTLKDKLDRGGYAGTGQILYEMIIQEIQERLNADIGVLQDANDYTDSKISSVYKVKGSVANYASLPSSGQEIGDVRNIVSTGMNYVWDGTLWDSLGTTVDVTSKLDKGTYTGNAGDLKTEIDNIFVPDTLISAVNPTRSVNTFTFPALGYQWLISKQLKSNAAQFVTTIAVASTIDHRRVDVIYGKADGTLGIQIGTESISVAPVPTKLINTVQIFFINIFGNTIDAPTPITSEISLQGIDGVELFKISNYFRIDGASINAGQKLISIDSQLPLSAFLNPASGNDSNAALENSKKPFKTIEALLNKLPATTGETYTIYITGGTVPITKVIVPRNLKFIAYSNTILDFTNVKNALGTADLDYVFSSTTNYTWTFENANISIENNFVGIKRFTSTGNVCPITIKGTINNLKWYSLGANANYAGFSIGNSSDFNIVNLYESPQVTHAIDVRTSTENFIRVTNYYFTNGRKIIGKESLVANKLTLSIINMIQSGNVTGLTIQFSTQNPITNVSLNNFIVNQSVIFIPLATNIVFNTVTTANVKIMLQGCYMISGSVTGVSYPYNSYMTNNPIFKNYSGLLSKLDAHDGDVTFENCNLIVDTYLVGRGYNSSVQNCVHFKGFNSVNQIDTTQGLFKTSGVGNSNIKPILIDIVNLTTNATTYGIYTTYIKTQSTFKEKLNEIVIRNKIDLINQVLSSTTKYIIDGNLVLLTGEYIQVPAGGLDLGGYGFDTSSISKNISGQSIFTSPAGNSGNFVSKDISYYPGLGSVFDITDSNGTHAIELNDVNFQGVTGSSLGVFTGYRQFTGTTLGIYNMSDGLTLEGNWSGFKMTNCNIIGFGSLGTGTLFKKGAALSFSNRFYIDLNLSLNTGAKLADFVTGNFASNELFQINNTLLKLNLVTNAAINTPLVIPNITANDPKSRWTNCLGLNLTAMPFFDLKSTNKVWRYTPDDTTGALIITDIT